MTAMPSVPSPHDRIELVPGQPGGDAGVVLRQLADEALTVRGVMAFWTVDSDMFGPHIARLAGGDGYLCADIHRPTNIDRLVELKAAGANVRLHLRRGTGQIESAGTHGMPGNLLHSKTLLFDLRDGGAAVWVGSHNATHRALSGINIETALLIRTTRDSALYLATRDHLDTIRAMCAALQPVNAPYYKWLQGLSEDKRVIELSDSGTGTGVGDQFALFITRDKDARQLRGINEALLLSITDTNGLERFYLARIGQAGELKNHPALGFSITRYAFRRERAIPELVETRGVPAEVVEAAAFFAVMTIVEALPPGTRAVESSRVRWWTVERRRFEDEHITSGTSRTRREVQIQEPVPVEEFRRLSRDSQRRRDDRDRDLVTRVTLIGGETADE